MWWLLLEGIDMEMVKKEDTVFMVSGYMRTGTSMMMRALEAGGLEVVARESRDEYRKKFADEYYDPNEGGLYELERQDYKAFDFPLKYKGKLIKCLMAGKAHIAVVPKLKVVFMRRDFEEIRQSYQAFFDNELGAPKERLEALIKDSIEQLRNRKDCDLQVFWYRDVVENPKKYFEILKNDGWPIDVEKAAAIVNPELCRFRKEILTEGIV
jgi:hypothetical protein